ncbi:MAG TPA: T9SS type A sorting domain-containing protein [Ignavibacteriaceae bacterium]|nr:T9SS type A sorting domain-containing protein [Ignavibacteriaceae bacterium]
MKIKIAVLLISANTILLFSQPNLSWIKEYDTPSLDEKGVSVTGTNNNDGYIICGYRYTPATVHDLFLIRTNTLGDTIWTKQYGILNGSDYGMQILKTGDGYVIGGMHTDLYLLYFDAWLLKINEDGDLLWSETLLDSARIKSICLTPDGGIAATGGKVFNGHNKLFIARFNHGGNLLWLNYYGNFYDSFGYDIICSQDSGFAILGGAVDSNATNTINTWLLKTDKDGNVGLSTVYNIYNIDGKIDQTYSGDFLLSVDMLGAISFLKINSNGEIQNSLTLSDDQSSPELIQTEDSNYILMYTTPFGSNDYFSIIFNKTDQNFNNIWTKEIFGESHYFGYGFIITSNNSIVVTGWADPINIQNNSILLARLDGDITPVELFAFRGRVKKDKVILDWESATEINNRGFDIERRIGKKWENIGFVAGFGTSSESKSYSFTDSSVTSGLINYRLKQIDLDGSFYYSNEVAIKVNSFFDFALEQNYPNPFNPATKIYYSTPGDGNVKLEVYNILGQKIATLVNENKTPGRYSVEFNAANLASGTYIYQLISGKYSLAKKMILLR